MEQYGIDLHVTHDAHLANWEPSMRPLSPDEIELIGGGIEVDEYPLPRR